MPRREKIGEGVLELRDDQTKLRQGIKSAHKQAKGLESQFKRTAVALIGIGTAAIALRKITRFVGDSVRAFEVQEEAETSLRAALAQTGKTGSAAFAKITQRASELQRVTISADEALIKATSTLALLAPALDPGELARAQEAIIGIADVFLKGDVANAAQLLGKTLGSTTNALTRYGIQVDVNATQGEKLRQILEKTATMFEVSKARTETLAGVSQQLANAWGDIQEAIGATTARRTNFIGFLREWKDVLEGISMLLTELGFAGQERTLEQVNKLLAAQMQVRARLETLLQQARDAEEYDIRRIVALEKEILEAELRIAQLRSQRMELLARGGGTGAAGRPSLRALPVQRPAAAQIVGGLINVPAERVTRGLIPGGPFAPLIALQERLQRLQELFGDMADGTEDVSDFMLRMKNNLGSLSNLVANQFAGAITGAIFNLQSFGEALRSIVQTVLQQLIGAGIRAGLDALLPFQRGGIIPGMGPRPILAHAGEGILTRRAVRQLGGPAGVQALNRGELRVSLDRESFAQAFRGSDLQDVALLAGEPRLQRLIDMVIEHLRFRGP